MNNVDKQNFTYNVYIPQLIGIKTNIKGFRWGFGKCDVPAGEKEFKNCLIRIYLEEKPDKCVFDGLDISEYSREFRYFKASQKECSVIFEQTLKRAVHLRYVLTVKGNEIFLTVGKSYLKLIKTKLMYVHPIAYILFDLTALLLLKNGMTTLYCSAVQSHNGKTVVFMAPPNTGKSLSVLKLKKDHGARIIAEDMAVTDGTRIWGSQHTNLYRDYHDSSLVEAASKDADLSSDSVDYICFLQKGSDGRICEIDDYTERMTLINHYSLGYYYSPCVRVLNYYYDDFSVREAEKKEQELFEKLQSNACGVLIEDPDPMRFAQELQAYIDRQ